VSAARRTAASVTKDNCVVIVTLAVAIAPNDRSAIELRTLRSARAQRPVMARNVPQIERHPAPGGALHNLDINC